MGRSITGKNNYPKTRKLRGYSNSPKYTTEEERKQAKSQAKKRYCENLGLRGHYQQERNKFLKRTFGISLTQYDSMLIAQNGRCAICLDKVTPAKALSVDHNHETGKVRQLLCHLCNVMLGSARESEDILMRAISYLRNHRDQQ